MNQRENCTGLKEEVGKMIARNIAAGNGARISREAMGKCSSAIMSRENLRQRVYFIKDGVPIKFRQSLVNSFIRDELNQLGFKYRAGGFQHGNYALERGSYALK